MEVNDMESSKSSVSRRSVVGGAALGVSALVLPTAAHAVSYTAEWTSVAPDTSLALIEFGPLGYGQLYVNWVRAAGETFFTYSVSIRASDVPAGKPVPDTQPVVYYGLPTRESGPNTWQGRQSVGIYPGASATYKSPPLYNSDPGLNALGITFEATFTSATGVVATVVRTALYS